MPLYYTQQPAFSGPQAPVEAPAPQPDSPFRAAAIPPQTDAGQHPWPEVGAYEAGVWAGNARNPQPMATEAKGSPTGDSPDASILQRAIGWAFPPRHPVPTVLQFRQYDGDPTPGDIGLHAEMIPGLVTPVPQGMTAVAGTGANTFRASPQPWDAGFTVGASVHGAR